MQILDVISEEKMTLQTGCSGLSFGRTCLMRIAVAVAALGAATGCSSDSGSGPEPTPATLAGTWAGTSWAVYPDIDGSPISSEEPITFHFDDTAFVYHWGHPSVEGESDSGRAEGSYEWVGNYLTLELVSHESNLPPLVLSGEFMLVYSDTLLSLGQHLNCIGLCQRALVLRKVAVIF